MVWNGVPLPRASFKPLPRAKRRSGPRTCSATKRPFWLCMLEAMSTGPRWEGRFLDVAVGAERAAGGEQSPGSVFRFGERAGIVGAFAAVAGADFDEVGGRPDGDHVEHAADGAGTIEIAGAAADEFGALNSELGLLFPVNPSADGVVEGHVVLCDEGAAGGG